ncbi:MAG: IMPACT family protein [Chitinophagaceae bacterium]
MSVKTADFFYTIDKPSIAEFKDKGSKFIGYAYPIKTTDEFKIKLQEVKSSHPKASHHCFAYRMGLDNNIYRVGDDGEPSGSAGRPILNAIDGREITDALVIVVRYFGGTLLGIPGLINAYKTTASLSLQTTPIIQKPILKLFELQFDYTQTNVIMAIAKQLNCEIFQSEAQLFAVMKIGVIQSKEAEFLHKLSEYHTIVVKKINPTVK